MAIFKKEKEEKMGNFDASKMEIGSNKINVKNGVGSMYNN
jgi:hypothetical protein